MSAKFQHQFKQQNHPKSECLASTSGAPLGDKDLVTKLDEILAKRGQVISPAARETIVSRCRNPDDIESVLDKMTVIVGDFEYTTITIKLPICTLPKDNNIYPPPRNFNLTRIPTEIGALVRNVAEGMAGAGVLTQDEGGITATAAARYILSQVAQALQQKK